jgi:hypothetical protein
MGAIRTIGQVTAPNTTGYRTPIYTGPVLVATGFSISQGIATVFLGTGNLPKNGYNGPNGYPTSNATTGSKFDIYGGISGGSGGPAGGQQVTLWGFTTTVGLLFNGLTVTVLDCDPAKDSFRFYFNHADDLSAGLADTGNTAAAPSEHYRAIHIEADASNSTNLVYVGDLNVSATRYLTVLSLAGKIDITIAGDNIPADRIFIFGSSATNCKVQVTLIY